MNPEIQSRVQDLKSTIQNLNNVLKDLHNNNVLVHLSVEKASSIDPTQVKLVLCMQHIDYLKEENK
jgi:hypothetical protein